MAEIAFEGAGRSPGLELWRIEAMAPVKQSEVTGKFHTGDSYILLSTTKSKSSNSLNWNIHFWLGTESSQDESGVAAYKSVELDESLGGGPIQYREVQGYESELFMSYFKKTGIEYLPGGVDSGFTHVEKDTFPVRLLQCKGKRTVRCTELTPCHASKLNTGDVFILDMGLQLFLYTGATANKYEKAKGFDLMTKIHNERGSRGERIFISEDPDNAVFWQALGGQMEITAPGDDDEAAAAAAASETKLFHVEGDSGNITTTEVPKNADGQFTRDMLNGDDAYILDTGSKLFVWVGKTASKGERKESMRIASKFLADTNRPPHTPIERVVQAGETPLFKSFFFQFDPPVTPSMFKRPQSTGVAAMPTQQEIDAAALFANQEAADVPVDDGSGKLEVWRVEDFKLVAVPQEKVGQFYGGDSYVLKYSYIAGNREEFIIYFWQGQTSSKDEVGASALLAKEMDDAMGGIATQVRVVQGKEPAHFRQLFKGMMIVHEGGKASGFKNKNDGDSYDDDGVSLFHVKGTNSMNTFGKQVKETAASLNSQDCFVLVTPSTIYSWYGTASNADEKAAADGIAQTLMSHSYGPPGTAAPTRELVKCDEEAEPPAFWTFIGGKAAYPKQAPGEPTPSEARLFHCTDAYGTFTVEEIYNFDQSDMLEDDVMLLDVGTTVYVWVGANATSNERKQSVATAEKYNASATDGREPDIPIVSINQGREPGLFTQFFTGWDSELFNKNKFVDPYEAKLAAMKAASEEQTTAEEEKAAPALSMQSKRGSFSGAADILDPVDGFLPESQKFPMDALTNGNCPVGVDPTKKERYLDSGDFHQQFGMDLASFEKLPAWKQKTQKKKLGLF